MHGDQCQFGAQIQSGNFKGHPTKKPTGFLTNAPKLAEVLAQRCTGIAGALEGDTDTSRADTPQTQLGTPKNCARQ